ncbi:MAG: hypothetical protein WKG07_19945, partial [Hymenobacter sp.]
MIVRRTGAANPARIKYIALNDGQPTEWLTNSGTVVGHAAATRPASAVAAVAYFDPQTPESYTAKGSPPSCSTPTARPRGPRDAPQARYCLGGRRQRHVFGSEHA